MATNAPLFLRNYIFSCLITRPLPPPPAVTSNPGFPARPCQRSRAATPPTCSWEIKLFWVWGGKKALSLPALWGSLWLSPPAAVAAARGTLAAGWRWQVGSSQHLHLRFPAHTWPRGVAGSPHPHLRTHSPSHLYLLLPLSPEQGRHRKIPAPHAGASSPPCPQRQE